MLDLVLALSSIESNVCKDLLPTQTTDPLVRNAREATCILEHVFTQ